MMLQRRCRSSISSRSSAISTRGSSFGMYKLSPAMMNLTSASRPAAVALAARMIFSMSMRLPSSGSGRRIGLPLSIMSSEKGSSVRKRFCQGQYVMRVCSRAMSDRDKETYGFHSPGWRATRRCCTSLTNSLRASVSVGQCSGLCRRHTISENSLLPPGNSEPCPHLRLPSILSTYLAGRQSSSCPISLSLQLRTLLFLVSIVAGDLGLQ